LARNWLKVVVKPVLAQKAACSEGRNRWAQVAEW
jgi:hypothetical protein